MRPRSTACCISFLPVLGLAGCLDGPDDARPARAEAAIRTETPAGFAPVEITLEEFVDQQIANRSEARFTLTAAPTAELAVLIDTIEGTNIVRPVMGEEDTITFHGSAMHQTPVGGSEREPVVTIDWDRGAWAAYQGNAANLRPLSSLAPYVVEGSEEAVALREARQQRLIAEAEAAEAQRVAEAEAASASRIETERIRTDERLELDRLRLQDPTSVDGGRWMDLSRFPRDGDRTLEPVVVTTRVAAPPEDVFELWTTEAGLRSFMGIDSDIRLRVGGAYEWVFLPDAEEGSRGGEGNRVLAFDEPRVLAFSWNAPPEFEGEREPRTIVVVTFDAVEGGTEVTLSHTGFRRGGRWDEVRAYFQNAWTSVLGALQSSVGPIPEPEPELEPAPAPDLEE